MQAKGFKGSLAGIPVRGGIVSIDGADAALMIDAATGLIRTTAGISAAALGAVGKGLLVGGKILTAGGFAALLLGALFQNMAIQNAPKMPLTSLANLISMNRKFIGICLNDAFDCICDGHQISIPIQSITEIKTSFWGLLDRSEKTFNGYNVKLIDGSSYNNCLPVTKELRFLTICGEQKTHLFRKNTIQGFFSDKVEWSPHSPSYSNIGIEINGATVRDVEELRNRLVFAFENNIDSIIQVLGKESFERYFSLR